MRNDHVFEYLDYYIGLPHAPNYAVMIDGAWGIGKTYHVKSYIDRIRSAGKIIVYASLYGVKSLEEIDLILLMGVHNIANNKIVDYGGRILKAAAKKFSFGADVKFTDFAPKTKIDLLVFDDLERSALSAEELLGFINTFVEHDNMKVLIVSNEEKMKEREQYRLIREKVVGITFKMQEEDRAALDVFIGQTSDPDARSFLTSHADLVLSIFQQSELHNLRILKQSVWAWDRFFIHIDPELKNKTKGMVAALKLFMALSFEVTAGRLHADDLTDRLSKIVAGQLESERNKTPDKPRLAQAQDRYRQIYLHDTVLSDGLLVQVLCEGRIDAGAINETLGRSEFFILPQDEPSWQKVWFGLTRDENEFATAVSDMERQFEKRSYVQSGEVLHVFGLRLWCAEIEVIQKTIEVVAEECKSYVDDLVSSGVILSGGGDIDWDDTYRASHGLTFMNDSGGNWTELRSYYLSCVKEAEKASWSARARELIELMKTDAEAFFVKVCWTNDERDNTFARIPIFATIQSAMFVDSLLNLPPADQGVVLSALKGRYESGAFSRELTDERTWLVEVRDQLLTRAATLSPIRRYAIRNEVRRALEPVLQ